MKLEVFDIVLGILYMTAFAIELFGLTAAALVRLSFFLVLVQWLLTTPIHLSNVLVNDIGALPLYIAKAAYDPHLCVPLPRCGARRVRHRINPRHHSLRIQGMCCSTLTLPPLLFLY